MNWVLRNKSGKRKAFQAAEKMANLHFKRHSEKAVERDGRRKIEQPYEWGLRGDILGLG